MVKSFKIGYQLMQHDGSPFEPCVCQFRTAYVEANDGNAACDKLKKMFSMANIRFCGTPVEEDICDSEYCKA